MTRQALAERKAQREALLRRAEREEILKKFASEEETYPASASFKYNEDLVNMQGEVDYPSMSLDNDGSNSLKEENPTWAEHRVPTVNPGSLQFPDVTKPMKFEGSDDGSLEYVVDWESLENPSEGLEDANLFEVPTQMPNMPHKTTRANAGNNRIAEKGKEKHTVECTSCGKRMAMSDEEMERDSTRCANDDCPTNKESGKDHDMDKEAQTSAKPVIPTGPLTDKVEDVANQAGQAKVKDMLASSSLDLARIKTAYGCSSKLALAGIITSDEVDSYAEQMLNDGLKADSMIRQTKLLLKSAQTSTERVAAAAAEKMTKTASTLGVSTSPAFNGSFASNSAALDIQGALKGTWTMPKLED
jgi:ssDNA-binding Zn-finger/Zn-ribbon topoisomerase 1